jgi:hypothetical protein
VEAQGAALGLLVRFDFTQPCKGETFALRPSIPFFQSFAFISIPTQGCALGFRI